MTKQRKTKHNNPLGTLADIIMTGASWASVVGLWVSAASVYVSPANVRLAGILGIGFPLMLVGTVVTLVLCLLFAPRRCWISLLGLICCIGSIRSYCPFNPFGTAAGPDALVVVSYNTQYFSETKTDEERARALQYFIDQGTDILVFQEGSDNITSWTKDLCPDFARRLPHTAIPFKGQSTVQGICSRYPIIGSELVSSHTGNAIVAFWLRPDKGDSLLVVNVHLKSNNLSIEDRENYAKIVKNPHHKQSSDSTLLTSRTLASKISSSAGVRALMADTLADFLARHPSVPTIVCGDFNDTPISYSTQRIRRSGLTDAFRTVGNGIARSFNKDAIAVRIDHQFCTHDFTPLRAEIDKTAHWSDHYPLIVAYDRVRKR